MHDLLVTIHDEAAGEPGAQRQHRQADKQDQQWSQHPVIHRTLSEKIAEP
jgi:hypothetical protein